MHIFLMIFLLFGIADAKSSYERGKEIYMTKACYTCHGRKAEGMHTYPRLANRAKGYMKYKLEYFRDKKADTQRQEMMITFSVDLSDQDIDDLTTFMNQYHDEKEAERYDDSYQTFGDGGS